jgi:hypothetical protein
MLNAWADGPNVGGGLRSKLQNGDRICVKITILDIAVFPTKSSNPSYVPSQEKSFYLKYDPDTNGCVFVKDPSDPNCIFKVMFADDNEKFQLFANQNNMGMSPRRNLFGIMNTNNKYFTVMSDNQIQFKDGMWPNNQPSPSQMLTWQDFSGYSIPKYPFGPYCPGVGRVIIRGEDGYAISYANSGIRQLMELIVM